MEQLSVMNKKNLIKTEEWKIYFSFIASWCPDCSFIKPHLPEIEQNSKITLSSVSIVMRIPNWLKN